MNACVCVCHTPFLPFSLSILLPILADLLVYYLLPATSYNSSRTDIATFGFLYGTFPTAPTVFVFASQYKLAMEIVSSSAHVTSVVVLSRYQLGWW